MKKTLIALAVLAASGASFAQSSVTLSGDVGFAFQTGLTAAAKAAGFDQSTGNVKLTISEDLGGGLKATAATQFDVRGRTTNNAEDTTLTLSGGFGTVMIGTIEAGNGIIGRAWAGAPISLTNGYDNGVLLGGVANADLFAYSTPAMNGFVASVKRLDSVGLSDTAGVNGSLQANVLEASYSAGPLNAGIDYTKYEGSNTNSRVRMSANYDLGVAVLGFGSEKTKNAERMTTMGVKFPMGALTLGAVYAQRGDQKGTAIGANYALSKRTSLNFSQGTINSTAYTTYNADAVSTTDYAQRSQYRLNLVHAF
jgi:hypothetical protein